MAHDYVTKKVAALGTYTVSDPVTIAWAPGKSAKILRLIFVFTTANTTAKNVLTMQRRPVAGAAANQVSLGTFELPAVAALGAVYYFDYARPLGTAQTVTDGSLVLDASPYEAQILPGQDFAIVSDGGGTAGVCNVYVEYLDTDQVSGTRVARVT